MSSAVDEDTARAINSGRETLGALFSSAQAHLQKVFLVFVAGFIGAFYALRVWVWDFLEAVAKSEMDPETIEPATDVITRTPFEVILLQAKIGIFVGLIVALPVLLYYSRDALRQRGVQSVVPISKRYAAGFVLTSLTLFSLGVVYAYTIFFPFAFDFLATNAVEAGVKPSFGITEFTQFIVLLTISFGLAAQLPLLMGALSYTEIVSYETFRDKWRHAVVAITVFGALFSPPDPFTLVMWATPMVILYIFSLGLAKLVTNIRRRGSAEMAGTGAELIKRRTLQFLGGVVAVGVGATVAVARGGIDYVEGAIYPALPASLRPTGPTALEEIAIEYGLFGDVVVGFTVAVVLGLLALLAYTIKVLQSPVYPRQTEIRTADSPDEVDFDVLDAEDVDELSSQVFLSMEEDEALEVAREAMYDDDREKAQAILDRYDSLQEAAEERGGEAADAAAAADEGEGDNVVADTAAGMMDAFTEDETTEEDIGGYAYDLMFIFESLTSRAFRIVAVFMVVMGGTFMGLYSGGLGIVLQRFLERVPDEVLHEVARRNGVAADPAEMTFTQLIQEMDIVVALEPVEVLIFEVKVSVLAGLVAILPMVLYYAWPAMKERGLVRGDRRVFAVWGGSLLAGFAVGTYLGFFWIAPAIISYLVSDAITNQMIVSYRIKSFFWLVIFTTVGIGFLMNMIVTMALFHVGGIVSYRTQLRGWRHVVVATFVASAFLSPKGILTMVVLAIPVALTYLLGLALLYVLTAGGRLFGGEGGGELEVDAEADASAAE
ncbi:twin-arginine translocase subunit TatC [Salinilacihabitans rarus]|uniref:twin-arginine translocase subunit TatC n=1 Tax=Salinilacihabitans rarus TaxID=2961596 RepID=UPI0020C8E725|nr:twin-arginine translocase subunit TatC [Salinilacihabitans rarus]